MRGRQHSNGSQIQDLFQLQLLLRRLQFINPSLRCKNLEGHEGAIPERNDERQYKGREGAI